MSRFALHPEAYDDINEIRAYIAEDSPDAADRVVNEIFDRIRELISLPDQGFRRPNLTSLPLRFVSIRDYMIAYAPEKKPLWIVAVFHGRRSPRVIAAILRGSSRVPLLVSFARSGCVLIDVILSSSLRLSAS